MAVWSVLLLLACVGGAPSSMDVQGAATPEEGASVASQASSPVVHAPDAVTVHQRIEVRVDGVPAGSTVDLLGSLDGTAPGAGPCPRDFGGVCGDLLGGRRVDRAIADARGVASFVLTLPASAPDTVWLQAARLERGGALISGVAPITVTLGERCDDGVDNDGDGLLDCDDPDCWAQGCVGRRAFLTEVDDASHRVSELFEQGCGASYTHQIVEEVELLQVRGELHVHDGVGDGAVCAWAADRVVATSTDGPYGPQTQIVRHGFTVEAGCGWSDDGFLPDTLFVDPYGDPGEVLFRNVLDHKRRWLAGTPGEPTTTQDSWSEDCGGWHAPATLDETVTPLLGLEPGVAHPSPTPYL